jgi:hypothetical protein
MNYIKYLLIAGSLTFAGVAQADTPTYKVNWKAYVEYPDGTKANVLGKEITINQSTCKVELTYTNNHFDYGPIVMCINNDLVYVIAAQCSVYVPGVTGFSTLVIDDINGHALAQFFVNCETTYTRVYKKSA